jgi:hypothetical protein
MEKLAEVVSGHARMIRNQAIHAMKGNARM